MARQRRPRDIDERQDRANARFFPGAARGKVANMGRVPGLPRGRTGSSGMGAMPPLPKHFAEVLKDAGEAPLTTYLCTFQPKDGYPWVWAGGVEQTKGVDFEEDNGVITILPAMDLHASDTLVTRYNWSEAGPSGGDIGTALVVSGRSLTGVLNLTVPDGASVGDYALCHFAIDANLTIDAPDDWIVNADVQSQFGNFPYGGVASVFVAKVLTADDLGATYAFAASAAGSNICGGMAVWPGASGYSILTTKANIGSVPMTHPTASGEKVLAVASVGTSLSGGTSMSGGTTLWNQEATYQHSMVASFDGSASGVTSTFSRESARIAQTVVIV